jgi:hypothetical protein
MGSEAFGSVGGKPTITVSLPVAVRHGHGRTSIRSGRCVLLVRCDNGKIEPNLLRTEIDLAKKHACLLLKVGSPQPGASHNAVVEDAQGRDSGQDVSSAQRGHRPRKGCGVRDRPGGSRGLSLEVMEVKLYVNIYEHNDLVWKLYLEPVF